MEIITRWTKFSLVILILVLNGCAQHAIYRASNTICESQNPETECSVNTIQQYSHSAQQDQSYSLSFLEFDDQGQLFDRQQMHTVLGYLNNTIAKQDLLMVVFVHGWKHSAEPGDDNIKTFRKSLQQLSKMESRISRLTGDPARKVTGIYLVWRGKSITLPVVQELTFWDRKNTAHKVGRGGVTEVLNRIEMVKKTKDAITDSGKSRSRLVVIGHSFGGAVVYSALSQILENRFTQTISGTDQMNDAQGFGDLVVLINPAFEAVQYTNLSDMSTERGTYFKSQLPVLVILTSAKDNATRVAFPAGRWFSTFFEKERTISRKNAVTGEQEHISQRDANLTAIGHFTPYRTHTLKAVSETDTDKAMTQMSLVETFFESSKKWERDTPGSHIAFNGSILERTENSAGRNPYLVIRVDKGLIGDHNDIDDPRIASFLRQLILISSQSKNHTEREIKRQKALTPKTALDKNININTM